ncbi:MAG TPA: DUF4127 family protein, partial [Candidatus Baltobacteraceae bacterium]
MLSFAAVAPRTGQAESLPPIVFVPLDDRPVTLQLPVLLAKIAGRELVIPPRPLLGHYLVPGDSDAILDWLATPATESASAFVCSADMIAYGGLVASRTPRTAPYTAVVRLRELAAIHHAHPHAPLDVFGTVMRLAPTGLPSLPATAGEWAVGKTVNDLQSYANLPDPPQTPDDSTSAEHLRDLIPPQILAAYLASRARDRDVDLYELGLAFQGDFDRIVIGQDDAGPVGLHVRDVAALSAAAHRYHLGTRASIEPGADELGMVLLASVFAREAGWRPTVRVRYSRTDAAQINDPLEFVPIDVTITRLIVAAGATRIDGPADIDLFVNVAGTNASDAQAFVDSIAADIAAGASATVADLTFLAGPPPSVEQQSLTQTLLARKLAGSLDGFASWNTTANTVGTSLATAIAAGAGRRTHRYEARAAAEF